MYTSLEVSTCLKQHLKSVKSDNWEASGLSNVARYWDKGCQIREALEIEMWITEPYSEHGLNQDDGKPMFAYLREKALHWCQWHTFIQQHNHHPFEKGISLKRTKFQDKKNIYKWFHKKKFFILHVKYCSVLQVSSTVQ